MIITQGKKPNMLGLCRVWCKGSYYALAALFVVLTVSLAQKSFLYFTPHFYAGSAMASYSTADCRQYNLSSHAFMEPIKSIIQHGNLADVRFIEKTLRTKFSSQYFQEQNGSLDPNRSIYAANNVLGIPINTLLDVPQKSEALTYHWTGIMTLDSSNFPDNSGDFIADCMHLTVSEFSSLFGSNFSYSESTGPVDPVGSQDGNLMMPFLNSPNLGYQQMGSSGLNDSKISLEFSFSKRSKLIYGVRIYQSR